ncbi:MAG TPA: enolase C-terminal domain-like protein [Terrimicrobiaceae bacterium]|nr:enolase C-terminal domain-like protein [Terrimicrobiaceae bacterium]
MKLEAERFAIRLPRPFRIAHGVSTTRETILVHARDDRLAVTAHGEGALPPYYPSRADACLAWVSRLPREFSEIPPAPPDAAAARVAVEIALQDLAALRAGEPVWKRFGGDPRRCPPCPMTLSIPQSERELAEMLDEGVALGSRDFKLKSGSGDPDWDAACARQVRSRFPEARLSLDANAGWSPGTAAFLVRALADAQIAFFEQPVGREPACWRELRQTLGDAPVPPLVADESLQTLEDLEALRGLADGVNIKLLKAGGLGPASQWIRRARALGFKVMIGVMVETGIGRTAAAQLAPLADWLDIDPPESIPVPPYSGFAVRQGHLVLSGQPGLGLRPCSG